MARRGAHRPALRSCRGRGGCRAIRPGVRVLVPARARGAGRRRPARAAASPAWAGSGESAAGAPRCRLGALRAPRLRRPLGSRAVRSERGAFEGDRSARGRGELCLPGSQPGGLDRQGAPGSGPVHRGVAATRVDPRSRRGRARGGALRALQTEVLGLERRRKVVRRRSGEDRGPRPPRRGETGPRRVRRPRRGRPRRKTPRGVRLRRVGSGRGIRWYFWRLARHRCACGRNPGDLPAQPPGALSLDR